MDTFICGTCQGAFNDIEVFMQHKQTSCSRPHQDVIQVHVNGSGEATEVTGAEGVMGVHTDVVSSTSPSTLAFLNEMTAADAAAQLTSIQGGDAEEGTTHTYIILNEADDGAITAETMQMESVSRGSREDVSGAVLGAQSSAIMSVSPTEGGMGTATTASTETEDVAVKKAPGRRGRRPRKAGEMKLEPMEAVASTPVKPEVPEKDKDGKLRCPNCHRVFNKERHFKTHKCLASSLYIDISKREVKLDSGDEGELEETEAGAIDDDQEEYRAPHEADHSEDSENLGDDEEGGQARKHSKTFRNIQLHTDADTEAGSKDRSTQGIEDVPIFRNDEEKIEFESTLNVDLSCIDHMFKVHVIDQDINENAGTYGRGQLASLSLYSCTVCDKVFKTLSHMRLHCLVHTDLKPFRCNKCQYQTNTKGNLYTHMRKHTGQYYQCKHCDFRSVNKSHLVEHEATHDRKRHPCAICEKDYATGKSLINHVRKYHANTRKGQQYLQTFLQGRQASGSTVIHQCHVCNRKFKKKIDRDRHLFVHDIRDVNMTHQCELCDYQASRRIYLEKHYTKHRVLYCCSLCSAMFLSTIKLMEHLTSCHSEEQSVVGANDEELFERCINSSLYLPEPDEQMPLQDKQFVNLPPELSSSAVNTNTSASANSTGVTHNPATQLSSGNPSGSTANITQLSSTEPTVSSISANSANITQLSSAELSVTTLNAATTTTVTSAVTMLPSSDLSTALPQVTLPIIQGTSGVREVTPPAIEVTGTELSSSAVEVALHMVDSGIMEETSALDGKMSSALMESSLEITRNLVMSCDGEGEEQEEGRVDPNSGSLQKEGATSVKVEKMDVDEEEEAGNNKITLVVNEQGYTTILPSSAVVTTPKSGVEEMLTDDNLKVESMPPSIKLEDGQKTEPANPPSGEQDTLSQMPTSVVEPLTSDSSVPLAPNPGMSNNQEEDFEEMENAELDRELSSRQEEDSEAEQAGEETARILEEDRGDNKKSIVERLGFRRMNMQIFQKMRETFGSEECEFCGRLFYTKQDYEPHLRTHTGDRPFRCTECVFKAITRESLRRHIEREHENVRYPCKDCNFVASNRTRLWSHQLAHLGISGLQCPHCPDKFETIKRLRMHMGLTHPDLPREELDRLTGYKHKMQGKMGRRSYKCPYCDRVFIRANSELQKHIWIHEGVKPFKCSLCTYACRSKNNLQAHMLRHSSHKPFACQECGRAYKSKTALRWHVRSHKTGNLFKCDKCPYEAQQRSHLKRHKETHEVVKRFICQQCNYSANTVGYMKIHYARTHKGLHYTPEMVGLPSTSLSSPSASITTEQQVFKCLSCDYRFGNLSDLKRHLKIKHHVQMQDFAGMDQMQISEVEVLQCAAEETPLTHMAGIVETSSVMGSSETVSSADLDEKTVSAVSLLQQIINMQGQGAFGQQEIKVMSEDGQLLSVNPETIIVQQHDGHQVLVTNSNQSLESAGQYIIQYVTPDDPSADPSMEGVPMEIQTVDSTESVQFITG